MGGSSNDNSFIPKRGPVSRPRRVASQQVYLFTVISYVLFFASLVAAIGVFLYDRYIDQQLENEVAALNTEIDRFREADLETVRMFNSRIEYTKERVNASVSVPSIFTVLENTTAETAQIESLAIERLGDSVFDVEAMMRTDTFDSSLFQREFYEQESTINDLALTDLTIETQGDEESENPTETFITFNAMLAVPVSSVPLTADMLTEPVSASVENEIIVDEIATSTDDSLGTNPDSV
jgi:hypothetical protein